MTRKFRRGMKQEPYHKTKRGQLHGVHELGRLQLKNGRHIKFCKQNTAMLIVPRENEFCKTSTRNRQN